MKLGFCYMLLLLILLDLIMNKLQRNPCLAEHFLRFGSIMVFSFTDHSYDPAIDDEHGTGAAWSHPAIKGCFFQRDAEPGSLADCILFGMNGSYAMLRNTTIFMLH